MPEPLPPLDSADVPRATYRVQLHAGFRFDDARALVPYLASLGFSHLYTSPFLQARAGSTHGYDVVDPEALNTEIGDEAAFASLGDTLAAHGLKLLADIVPNHMGVLQADNPWWLDVLAHGPASLHAESFDIDWTPPGADAPAQLLLPVLGAQYGEELEAGELVPVFDAASGSFRVDYHEHHFPLDPRDSAVILRGVPPPPAVAEAVVELLAGFEALPLRDDPRPESQRARREDAPRLQAMLRLLHDTQPQAAAWIGQCLAGLCGQPGEPGSFDALDTLIRRQAWRAAHWRAAGDEINYRRFFDVSTLAALRTEREPVFAASHRRLLAWLAEGRLHGLRIDHPDGLADPLQYFCRLQAAHEAQQRAAGIDPPHALYLLIEKILAPHEHWPSSWPVHGDTGYRFGSQVNAVFVDAAQAQAFDALYEDFVGERIDYEAELLQAKRDVMAQSLAADLHLLSERAWRIAQADRRSRDFTRNGLRLAIAELAAGFPVYRSYLGGALDDPAPSASDRQHLDWALAAAQRAGVAEPSTLEWLHRLLLESGTVADPSRREATIAFVRRFQQFTAPVMAKSMEDTAFYRYHRLVSLNEVGGEPRQFGASVAAFHAANVARQRFLPHCMLGTSTHDSKRSEDVRARLDVLSECPQAWAAAIARWREANAPRAVRAEGEVSIAPNDEMLLYQTLVGIWPVGPLDEPALADLRERVQAYMLKALREAKQRSSWLRPDEACEQALQRFIGLLLERPEPNPFLSDLRGFVEGIAPFGAWNSLNQLLFKLTAPGVPDVYQGCEGWSFSLVDPDNRRPVDFETARAVLAEVQSAAMPQALAAWRRQALDPRIKPWLCWRLLQWRAAHEALGRQGRYLPLAVDGPAQDHVVAYARHDPASGDWALVVGTRLLHRLTGGEAGAVCDADSWTARWQGTRIRLPDEAPAAWRDALAQGGAHRAEPGGEGDAETLGGAWLPLAPLLAALPFALLVPADQA